MRSWFTAVHPADSDAVLYRASPISEEVLERAMRAFPRAAFTQLYGMTEAAGTTMMLGPGEHRVCA